MQSAAREQLDTLLANGPLPCTLSLPVGEGRTGMRRSRLLSSSDEGVRVETPAADREGIVRLIDPATPILVTARPTEGERLFFAAPLRIDADKLPDTDVVTLAMPEKVLETQRRSYFRVPISPSDGVHVRLWRINNYVIVRDRALPSQELPSELLDLGAGGMRCVVHARGQASLGLVEDQRFRIELTTDKHEMILEGRLRYPRVTNRDDLLAVCGIRFLHRDNIASRANLQHLHALMATLQRNAVRSHAA